MANQHTQLVVGPYGNWYHVRYARWMILPLATAERHCNYSAQSSIHCAWKFAFCEDNVGTVWLEVGLYRGS